MPGESHWKYADLRFSVASQADAKNHGPSKKTSKEKSIVQADALDVPAMVLGIVRLPLPITIATGWCQCKLPWHPAIAIWHCLCYSFLFLIRPNRNPNSVHIMVPWWRTLQRRSNVCRTIVCHYRLPGFPTNRCCQFPAESWSYAFSKRRCWRHTTHEQENSVKHGHQ